MVAECMHFHAPLFGTGGRPILRLAGIEVECKGPNRHTGESGSRTERLGSVVQKRYNPGMDSRPKGKISIPLSMPTIGCVLILSAASCTLEAQAPASVWDGAYSAAQAQRGETQYKQQCAVCHGEVLEGDAQTERGKQ